MSAKFTREDVQRLARLARVELTDAEQDLFAHQLGDILAYAEQLQTVDTNGVDPMSHALATTGPLRADEVVPSLDRDLALNAAPDASRAAGLFKVPRVLA
jgi:aspartyl-tRNA(Asn)/glutamyl-tRNA(Gln) amidotransferase subunit C